jgi:hypothetical protein
MSGYIQMRKHGVPHTEAFSLVDFWIRHWLERKFGTVASAYIKLHEHGMPHNNIMYAIYYCEDECFDVDEITDFFISAIDSGVPYDEAYTLLTCGSPLYDNLMSNWEIYRDLREKGLDVLEAKEVVIRATYCLNSGVPIDAAIQFYWHIRDLDRSHDEACYLMRKDQINNPRFDELWPYYVSLKDEYKMDWYNICWLMNRASSYTKVNVDEVINFRFRMIGLGGKDNDAYHIINEDNVSNPDFFIKIWPVYAECRRRKICYPEDATNLINFISSNTDKTTHELVDLYQATINNQKIKTYN